MIKWISVKDRLPKNNERVLVVCVNRENHDQRHVSICTFWGGYFGRPPTPIYRWSGNKIVSHWASLPELPDDIIFIDTLTLEQLRDRLKEKEKKTND